MVDGRDVRHFPESSIRLASIPLRALKMIGIPLPPVKQIFEVTLANETGGIGTNQKKRCYFFLDAAVALAPVMVNVITVSAGITASSLPV